MARFFSRDVEARLRLLERGGLRVDARLQVGGVDLREELAGGDRLAFAHEHARHLARHLGLDRGLHHRRERARERDRAHEAAHLDHRDVGRA